MFDTILAAVDYSVDSAAALREAAQLALALNARLVVLHAEPLEVPAYFTSAHLAEAQPAYREAAAQRVREFTASTLGMERGTAAEVRFADIEASAAILDAAADCARPLIVMGTHGRTGLQNLLYGSTTERVMQGRFPVLAVRAHDKTGGGMAAPPSEQAEQLARILGVNLVNADEAARPAELHRRAKEAKARFAFSPGSTSA